MRAWAVVENGKPFRKSNFPRPSPKAPRCCSKSPIAASATPICISGRVITTSAAGRRCPGGPRCHVAPRHGARDRRPRRQTGPRRVRCESRRSAHRLPLARLRHVRDLPRRGRQHGRRAARSLAFTQRRLRHAVIAPHPGIWSIPARSIPLSPPPMPAPASRSTRPSRRRCRSRRTRRSCWSAPAASG